MPIEPPDPLNVLDALRSVLAELQRLTELHPSDERLASAVDDVKSAIAKVEPVFASKRA